MSENGTGFRVHDISTELALMRQRLDTVIEQHGKEIIENKTTVGSAHSKIAVLELQVNTHEVKIAELVLRSTGAYGKFWMLISGLVGLGALIVAIFK